MDEEVPVEGLPEDVSPAEDVPDAVGVAAAPGT
jgi:hypothetical protein